MITTLENNSSFRKQQEALDSSRTIERYKLYVYFPGEIVDFPSSSQIKVWGKATSQIVNGNEVIITSEDFETLFTVSGSSYSEGYTTITVGSSISNTTTYGGYVGVSHDVTNRVIKGHEPTISSSIEGDTLNAFDSGQANIVLHNNDKSLWDEKNRSGLLYHFAVAGTFSSVTSAGSSLTDLDLNEGTFDDDIFLGYLLTILTGSEEEEVFPVVGSSGSSVQVWALEDVNASVGDEFILNVSRDITLRITGGFPGIYL